MKTIKGFFYSLLSIIKMLCDAILAISLCWYIMPGLSSLVDQTGSGKFFRDIFLGLGITSNTMVWMLIISAFLSLTIFVLNIILGKSINPKYRNIYIHINSWVVGLLITALSIYTFVCVDPLTSSEITLSVTKKASIGILLAIIIVCHFLSNKLAIIINRKIQAYETAKEMDTISPWSTVFINFLKLFELFFPEMLILILLCLLVSWNVACYFVIILIAIAIPMIGNIACDFNRIRYSALIRKVKYKTSNVVKEEE